MGTALGEANNSSRDWRGHSADMAIIWCSSSAWPAEPGTGAKSSVAADALARMGVFGVLGIWLTVQSVP
jgi:hypothetical protein